MGDICRKSSELLLWMIYIYRYMYICIYLHSGMYVVFETLVEAVDEVEKAACTDSLKEGGGGMLMNCLLVEGWH
jgi:hypothetical protein